MENVSGGMESLSEDIVTSHKDRERRLKDLREEAGTIRASAREFVSTCKKLHQGMAKDLRKNLLDNREELVKNVKALREDFRREEKEICSDLTEASKIWNKMKEILRAKKTKSRKRGEKK